MISLDKFTYKLKQTKGVELFTKHFLKELRKSNIDHTTFFKNVKLGVYKIKVVRQGYITKKGKINLQSDTYINIKLKKVKSIVTPALAGLENIKEQEI